MFISLDVFKYLFIIVLITSNAFYVVLTPSTHGDFIACVLIRVIWDMDKVPIYLCRGMFLKHGVYVVLKKSKMWRCGVESSKTFIM